MKIFLVSKIFLLLAYFSSFSQSNIRLEFSDISEIELPFYINLPLSNGEFCNYHHVVVRPDQNGIVALKLPIEKPGLISFSINRKKLPKSFNLYIEPNKNLVARIDDDYKISFEGSLKDENSFLNSLNRLGFPHGIGMNPKAATNLSKEYDPRLFIDSLKWLENNELTKLKKIVTSSPKALSKTFVEMVKLDIHYYYLVVGAAALEIRFYDDLYNNHSMDSNLIATAKPFWEFLYSFENRSTTARFSFWYSYFIYDYIMLYKTFFLKENYDSSKQKSNHLQIGFINANKYLDPKEKETFLTYTFLLWFQGTGNQTPILMDYFYTLRNDFPSSGYLKVIAPKALEMEKSITNSVDYTNNNIVLLQDFENIDSFNVLMGNFKGKIVLIDLWASWCGPCIEAFENNYAELKKLQIEHSDFEILFVSLDKMEQERVWKNTIYLKDLSGYHIIPNKKLLDEMKEIINWTGIPRYVIVNKQGKIISNPAPKPSDGNNLINELMAEIKR